MDTIEIDMARENREHLEFEVEKNGDGTFTVLDHCTTMKIRYTGFPNRKEAEKFVLAQPEVWE